MHEAVFLIIRRSWVRAPPSPPDLTQILGRIVAWIVDRYRWSGVSSCHGWCPERTQRPTAKSVLARQGVGRNRPAHKPGDRFRRTERAAQIELGKLLAMAQAGRQADSAVTVAQLLDQYVSTAGWDMSTRESNLGYIRRTIKPALGSTQVRKVRGPLLDTLYARLMRCGNLVHRQAIHRASQHTGPAARPGRPAVRMAAGRGSCAGSNQLPATGPR